MVHVDLAYRAKTPGAPSPNFSPKGMQVPLAAVPETAALPAGAVRPAKTGVIKIGLDQASWIPVLATATTNHPKDLCQVFLDRNRNGNFADDGPGLTAQPTQNAKTKAWWSSIDSVELSVPYGPGKGVEPYQVNFWIVREEEADAPEILRFSVGSWRYGTVTIQGVPALVAVMDSDNNAIFDKKDTWSVLEAVGAECRESGVDDHRGHADVAHDVRAARRARHRAGVPRPESGWPIDGHGGRRPAGHEGRRSQGR